MDKRHDERRSNVRIGDVVTMDEIVNKVAESSLEIFDLEDYYVSGNRVTLDISQWLFEGFVLKEKEFRQQLKDFDWSIYKNSLVAITCSTDAILPAWTFMLVASHVLAVAKNCVHGSIHDLDMALYQQTLAEIDFSVYQDKPVIIKGCSDKDIPQEIYSLALQKLQPFARSIMYGEACSAVPIFKKSKK